MNICPFCGAQISRSAKFCQVCGRRVAGQRASSQKAILNEDFDVSAVTRLRKEKSRLSQQLNGMLDIAADRELSSEEHQAWNALRAEFHKVSDELTARLQHLSARQERDRRKHANRRSSDRRREQHAITFDERRSGIERRIGERRSGRDRREPFDEVGPATDDAQDEHHR
jgi:hypothetical protein